MNIVEAVSDRKTDRAKLGIHITKFISFFGIGSLAFIFKGWAIFDKKTNFIIKGSSGCLVIVVEIIVSFIKKLKLKNIFDHPELPFKKSF